MQASLILCALPNFPPLMQQMPYNDVIHQCADAREQRQ
jgi:hypothetical protein